MIQVLKGGLCLSCLRCYKDDSHYDTCKQRLDYTLPADIKAGSFDFIEWVAKESRRRTLEEIRYKCGEYTLSDSFNDVDMIIDFIEQQLKKI